MNFEKNLEHLAREIKEYQTQRGVEKTDQSSVREVLKGYIQHPSVTQVTPSEPAQSSPVNRILPDYVQKTDPAVQEKVAGLIDLALHKGILLSIQAAAKQGPFMVDALHDALTTKIYQELRARKLI
ncbi:MAG TPA: hypothetical protein VJH70_00035 [Candidatus Paceibacterota bacterium]